MAPLDPHEEGPQAFSFRQNLHASGNGDNLDSGDVIELPGAPRGVCCSTKPLQVMNTISYASTTPFSDQLWTICMEFGQSATKFDSPHAESCPNDRRNAEASKLPALFPNCMHCRLDWPEKGVCISIVIPMHR